MPFIVICPPGLASAPRSRVASQHARAGGRRDGWLDVHACALRCARRTACRPCKCLQTHFPLQGISLCSIRDFPLEGMISLHKGFPFTRDRATSTRQAPHCRPRSSSSAARTSPPRRPHVCNHVPNKIIRTTKPIE